MKLHLKAHDFHVQCGKWLDLKTTACYVLLTFTLLLQDKASTAVTPLSSARQFI
jgi:hypothetical protein